MSNRKGLGKGLSALIPVKEEIEPNSNIKEVLINKIHPNPNQPRHNMDQENLRELIESIKSCGLIQPIVVRAIGDNEYEIIAGERRWLACKESGLEKIEVIIKQYSDLEASAAALIENIQRENLNAVEEAGAYRKLMDNYGLTQEELSVEVGKSRSFIGNMVRLLTLPEAVKEMILEGAISAGHARALLPLVDSEAQTNMGLMIIKDQLSVRKTEELVKKINDKLDLMEKSTDNQEFNSDKDNEWAELIKELGKDVAIKSNSKGGGKLIIKYKNREQLMNIVQKIKN